MQKFRLQSEFLNLMPWVKIDGDVWKYRQQETLPGIANRALNMAYTESTGRLSSRQEDVTILGGQFFVDRAERRFMRSGGDSIDLVAEQARMKAMALGRELERQAFEGDKLVNPLEMNGLRPRITGSQAQLAGAGGAALTLTLIDALIDSVSMSVGSPHFFTSKIIRRKWTNLAKASGGSVQIQYTDVDKLGDQIAQYDGIPIHVVEDDWDGTTILDTEDPGDGTVDCYSIYLVRFGMDGVHGLLNGDGPLVDCYQVAKETEAGPPGELWRIEMYPGMVVKHPRSVGRLYGILPT